MNIRIRLKTIQNILQNLQRNTNSAKKHGSNSITIDKKHSVTFAPRRTPLVTRPKIQASIEFLDVQRWE